jgi:type I restriction enzyme, S subunit
MKTLRPYPEYKPSGVEWLGEIPVHWELKRLKLVAPLQAGYAFKSDSFQDEGVPVVRMNNLRRGKLDLSEVGHVAQSDAVDAFALRERDIVLGMSGSVGDTGSLGNFAVVRECDLPCQLNQRVGRFHLRKPLNQDFLPFFIQSKTFTEPVILAATSTAQFNVSPNDIGSILVAVPALDEQEAIAKFLDRETARIDGLVAKKERLIALLQEKRTALISHAVTKGLNPAAPMKDSGVEWLGQIPAHWEVKRLAIVASKITNGFVGPTRDILVDNGVRYLQSLHIKNGEIRFDTPYFVRPEWSQAHAKSVLQEGDVLIVQTGDLGQCCAVTKQFENCNCHALIIVRLRDGIGSGFFLSAFLRSHYGRASLQCCQTGATLPHLECGKIREIPIALPPPSEQTEIVSYLDRETGKLDALAAKIRTGIERLQEYRTALISAAVTGKINVSQT